MALFSFLKKSLFSILLSFIVVFSNGCIYLVVGGVGALGGYVVSPDTVEGELVDYSQDECWESAIEVISIMGVITESDESAGIILAKIQGAKVSISLIPMSRESVKLSVKARKSFFPKVRIAQDVYVKIVNRL